MDVRTLMWICALLTLQYKPTLSQDAPRDEYTADRKYYKINQNLTSIPTDIPEDALEVYIQDNHITTIEANIFSNLSHCTVINLETNKISEVGRGAFNGLTALEYLWIDGSELKALYANMFSNLSNCTMLFVHFNHIRYIEPGSFNGLSNLETLSLFSNLLTTVNAGTFQGLVGLKMLLIFNNTIESIEENTFVNLKTLWMLWMSGNDLRTVRAGTFFGLDSLMHLYLSNNYLETLTAGTFSGLDSLTNLELQNNHLKRLTAGSFSGLPSLQELLLHGNRLTLLPADVFSLLPQPLSLALHDVYSNVSGDNPLQCDAELCWLKQEELQGNITWSYFGGSLPYKPRCVNGIQWDTWRCDVTVIFPISSASTNGKELVTSIGVTTATASEHAIGTDATETQIKDDSLKLIFVTVGVAVITIIMSVITVVICFKRHGMVCWTKKSVTLDDNMRVEIVDKEEPMATEEEDTYATIGETNIAERNNDAENPYHGEVEVTSYNDPDRPPAEDQYYGNVEVKMYNDDAPAPFETRL